MYLNLLNRRQKDCFLGLAYNVSNADGDFCEQEHQLLESYCKEMEIEYTEATAKKKIDDILAEITTIFNEKTIKIVLFELIGLVMVDKKFDDLERDLINKIISFFPIDSNFLQQVETLVLSYLDLQNSINALILD